MKDKKVVFMGTPVYSVPVLEMLIENTNVVGVVTQPDKLVGRKKTLTPSPVKEIALKNNIAVFSPRKLKDEYEEIFKFNPDIIITCAYGQMIPEQLINYPKYKTVNVHASLLPKYRGGAPIHWAIINGDEKTGITIMFTDIGMDNGDILSKKEVDICLNDNYDVVSQKLSFLGADLLKEVLPKVFDGSIKRIKQNESEKSLAPTIKREDEHIDFKQTSLQVHNKIRGLSSVPGAYAIFNDKNVKIYKTTLDDCISTLEEAGTITRTDKNGIYVACGDGEIKLLELQFNGKKRMLVKDYLNGSKDLIGKRFY